MFKALRYFGWPLLTGILIAMLIIQRFPQWVGLPSQDVNLQQAPQTTRIMQGPVSYADAVTLAAPAVANLYTTKVVNKSAHPLFEDPQFRRFFGDNLPKQRRWESSLGSAVIMSPEGYLLTNNHVTSGADQIVVALKDGRETLARVIGSDPETDLAVLKIDLKNLPAITIGRSDTIHIGDVSLAIGNPFGVGQTVTMGIISALGRNHLDISTFENFIQTDAAINPGNSGGALVDVNGNLLGINTAIYSRSGGNMGIGFAIPVSTARSVLESIITTGGVTRGWVGVEPQDITSDIAESFGLQQDSGVIIAGVVQGGPADKAGVQPGDILTKVNDESIRDTTELLNVIAQIKPGTQTKLHVTRKKKELDLTVTIGKRPPPPKRAAQDEDDGSDENNAD